MSGAAGRHGNGSAASDLGTGRAAAAVPKRSGGRCRNSLAVGLEPEDMEPMFSSALQSFYVLERRGILDGEAFNQFLAGLPVYQVLRVSQLPPASQEAGLRTGDRILGLNGRYFSGERHARDLMAEIDGGTFLVLRDGQRLELARVPDMEFGAMVEFYWKETEDGA